MEPTHNHHHPRHTHKNSHGLERFLNSKLFIFLGVIFIVIGVYSLLANSDGSGGLYQFIVSFLTPVDGPVIETAGSGLSEVILYFLPPMAVLIGILIFRTKYHKLTFSLSVLSAIYLFIIQVKISFVNVTFGGCFYPDYLTAVIFLWIPTLLLMIVILSHQKSALLISSCFYFYASILLLSTNFPAHFEFVFTFIVLFTALGSFTSQKIHQPVAHWVNLVCAYGFLGLFWLRKFVVNAKQEFLPIFFIFGFIFFILFYVITLFTAGNKENPLPRRIQLFMYGTNLLVYLGTTAYVLIHYYTTSYLALFVAGLLLFHILGLYLIKRFNSTAWTLPHYYAVIGLASLVLPLIVQQGRLIMFTATLSVLMVGYAIRFKRQTALWISIGSLAIMFVWFLVTWARVYAPLQLVALTLPDQDLMITGFISCIAVTGALWLTAWQLQKGTLPISTKTFNKLKYERMVRVGMLGALILTLGLSMYILASQTTGTTDYTSVAWFNAGMLFFIGTIYAYRGKVSSFKKPLLYIALLFMLGYPALVHWNMVIFRNSLIMAHDLHASVLVLHYLALVLVLILGRLVLRRIYRQNQKKATFRNGVELFTALSLLFLFCTEYDNLSIILSAMQNTGGAAGSVGIDQLTFNKYLPYTVLLGIVSIIMFIRAVIRKNRFLRNFSIVLYIIMLVKLFVLDFESLSAGARTSVFMVLGLFLIGFAFVYPRLGKNDHTTERRHD